MSSAQKGGNLLSYLPPEQRQRVVLLIQRLQEQTQAKNKLQALYTQARGEIGELQLKCSQLKDQNAYLKQQLHSSFSMIAQVRENFKASSRKRKQRQNDWEDEDDASQEEENHQDTSNVQPHRPKPILKSLEKYRPQMTSADKLPSSSSLALNVSSSLLNQSGVKGREVEQLRREVRALQAEKQREQEKAKQITQKHRMVDEIKNRYRGMQESSTKRRDDSAQKIEITDTFLEEDHEPTYKEKTSAKKIPRLQETVTPIAKIAKIPTQPSQKIEKKVPAQPILTQKERERDPMRTYNEKHPPPPPHRHAGPSQDYCDVLDLINDYNL